MKIYIKIIVLVLFCNSVFAASSPVSQLEKMSNSLSVIIKKNKNNFNDTHAQLYRLVNRIIVPNIDKKRMAQAVVGRRYWQPATVADRSKFIRLFTQNIVTTYASAIKDYDNYSVKFYPLADSDLNKRVVNVKAIVSVGDSPSIKLIYVMLKVGNKWKIIDFSVDGISLINSYRAQFSGVLSSGGLALLNIELDKKV